MHLAVILVAAAVAAKPAPYKSAFGPHKVTIESVTWNDAAREKREVPAKIYWPDVAACPCPVVVFSPGLGGSNEHYVYVGSHWASHGYVVAVLTHRGSDTVAVKAAWKTSDGWPRERVKKSLATVIADSDARKARPKDVSFALDQLAARNESDAAWKGKLDLAHVGVAGHSYGAWTTMVTMGAGTAGGEDFRDARFVAGVAMSPQGMTGWSAFDEKSWAAVTSPMLYLTGTKDDLGDQPAKGRRGPFDHSTAKDQYLVIIDDAAHLAFSDNDSLLFGGTRDKRHHGWILQETTAFWDATLRGDATAKAWLDGESLESVTGGEAKVEHR